MCRPFMQPTLLLPAHSHPRLKALKSRLLSCSPFFQVDTYATTFLDLPALCVPSSAHALGLTCATAYMLWLSASLGAVYSGNTIGLVSIFDQLADVQRLSSFAMFCSTLCGIFCQFANIVCRLQGIASSTAEYPVWSGISCAAA